MKGGRQSTDKAWRGAGEAEDKTWWERRLKQMWGVLKSETRQLVRYRATHFFFIQTSHTCGWAVEEKRKMWQTVHTVWRHMAQVENWIIKASLTKACAPPPAERRCQRSVTSSIYVHWSFWWGWGFLLKALHCQLLYLSFTCRKRNIYFVLVYFVFFICFFSFLLYPPYSNFGVQN